MNIRRINDDKKKEQRMNEEIIFKWDGENDRESVKKCIWKNSYVKCYHNIWM